MSNNFTPEHCELFLKEHLAPKYQPTDEWLKLFTEACNRTGLDPAKRQILGQVHNVKLERNGVDTWIPKFSTLVTIDGLRVISERSGKYEGQCGPYYCGKDGEWRDVWLEENKNPVACRVGIFRKGTREPIWGIALFKEFKQNGRMWSGMPCHMIAKCAEAVGHRKAFPEVVAGLYIEDEMPEDGNIIPEGMIPAPEKTPPADNSQSKQRNAEPPQKTVPEANSQPEEQPTDRAKQFASWIIKGVTKDTLEASKQRTKVKLANYPALVEETICALDKAVA